METDRLYRLGERDFPRMVEILTQCFAKDPLYCHLIPDPEVRSRALPELFSCDIGQMMSDCQIYADSPDINGLIIVDDESEPYNPLEYYANEAFYSLKADAYLIWEDLSLKTLFNFLRGGPYLDSRWTDRLEQDQRLHIIYLAVTPDHQGEGLARKLLSAVLEYADQKGLLTSLETHNVRNVSFYEQYGFQLFDTVCTDGELKQYCMIRPAAGKTLADHLSPEVLEQVAPGMEL